MNRVLVSSTSRALVSLLMVAALIWSGVALTVSPRTVDAALVNSGSTSVGMINSEDGETKDDGNTGAENGRDIRSSPVSASNGIASGFPDSDGVDIYTSDVTPSSLGRVTVNIAGGLAEDANAAAPPLPLGISHDLDGDGRISTDEVFAAIDDYFDGNITIEQLMAVIVLYFQGGDASLTDSGPADSGDPPPYFDASATYRVLTRYGSSAEVVLADFLAEGVTDVSFSLHSCDDSRADYYDSATVATGNLVLEPNTLGHVHGANTETETVCTVTATDENESESREFRFYTVSDRTPLAMQPGALTLSEARSSEIDIQISLPSASLGYLRVGWIKSGGQPSFGVVSGATDGMVLTIPGLEASADYDIRVYLMTTQAFDLFRASNTGSPGTLIQEGSPDSKWVSNLSSAGLGKSQALSVSTPPEPAPDPTPVPSPTPEATLAPTPRPTPDDDDDDDDDGIDTPFTDNDGIDTPFTDNDGIDTPLTDNDGIDTPFTDNDGIDTPFTDNDGIDTPFTDNDGIDTPDQVTPTPETPLTPTPETPLTPTPETPLTPTPETPLTPTPETPLTPTPETPLTPTPATPTPDTPTPDTPTPDTPTPDTPDNDSDDDDDDDSDNS